MYRFAVRERHVSKQMPSNWLPCPASSDRLTVTIVQFVVDDDHVFVALFCQQQIVASSGLF
jgi:hypothetical protein